MGNMGCEATENKGAMALDMLTLGLELVQLSGTPG